MPAAETLRATRTPAAERVTRRRCMRTSFRRCCISRSVRALDTLSGEVRALTGRLYEEGKLTGSTVRPGRCAVTGSCALCVILARMRTVKRATPEDGVACAEIYAPYV